MPTSIRRRRTGELIAPCRDTFGYNNSQTDGQISPHIDNFYITKRSKKKDSIQATMKPLTQTFITSDQLDNNTAIQDENDEILRTDTKKSLLSKERFDLTSKTTSSLIEPLLSLPSKTSPEGTDDDDKEHLLASSQHRYATYHDTVVLESSDRYSNNFILNQTSFNDDRVDEEGARVNNTSDVAYLKAKVHKRDTSTSRNRRKAKVSHYVLNIVWIAHFVVAIFVLGLGISHNSNPARKYVVENTEASSTIQCRKMFIDVLASSSSIDDKDATVCCNDMAADDDYEIHPLCSTSPYTFLNFVSNLPLASRLSKFPDAWLIPLAPLIVVIVLTTIGNALNVARLWSSSLFGFHLFPSYGRIDRTDVDVACTESTCHSSILLLRRFFLYIILMMFRGWILYAGLNKVEQVVNDWHQTECNQSGQRNCSGLAFDFSDHIVLYYAQILPIGIMETLYWTCQYYPSSHETNRRISGGGYNLQTIKKVAFISLLVVFQLYIQLITSVGAYKTTSYFHTAGEVCVGFVVSFTISYPLWQLQCGQGRYATAARHFFFG